MLYTYVNQQNLDFSCFWIFEMHPPPLHMTIYERPYIRIGKYWQEFWFLVYSRQQIELIAIGIIARSRPEQNPQLFFIFEIQKLVDFFRYFFKNKKKI